MSTPTSKTRQKAQSQLVKRREGSKLPNLKQNQQATAEDINQIKLQILEIENERRQLAAKTSRMEKLILQRRSTIDKAMKQPVRSQKIVTASQAQINQLEEEAKTLSQTLSQRKKYLKKLNNSEKRALVDELQIDIQMYSLELQRLQKEYRLIKSSSVYYANQLNRINENLSNVHLHEKSLDDLQQEITQLTDKIFAYKTSDIKRQQSYLIQEIAQGKKQKTQIDQHIQEEIEKINQKKEDYSREIIKIQENERKNIEYLDSYIQKQTKIIQDLLQNPPKENEEKDYSESQDQEENSKPTIISNEYSNDSSPKNNHESEEESIKSARSNNSIQENKSESETEAE